jgi:hypothetical protein
MKKKEHKDAGGRTLVLWDRLPGKLSIAAPGEGGFVFLADKEIALNLISDLCEWYNEQRRNEGELRLQSEVASTELRATTLRGGIDE